MNIKQPENRFDDWSEKLMEFVNNWMEYKELPEEEEKRILFDMVGVVDEIYSFSIKHGKLKGDWDDTKFMLIPRGISVIKKSKRTNLEFSLLIEPKGISLEAHLMYSGNIRYMGDDFWKMFLNLSEYGKFELFENEIYSNRDADSSIGNKKSKLFRYIRNYILSGVSDGYNFDNPPMTTFIVSWPPETYWDELLPKLTSAMKDLYKLDYMLWQVSYQKENVEKNRLKQ